MKRSTITMRPVAPACEPRNTTSSVLQGAQASPVPIATASHASKRPGPSRASRLISSWLSWQRGAWSLRDRGPLFCCFFLQEDVFVERAEEAYSPLSDVM